MGRLDIIRSILADGPMPRQRFQNPSIQQNENGSYFIRPWVDKLSKSGELIRGKKTFVLGPASIGKRRATALKNEIMGTVNRADYVIKSQIKLNEFLPKYRKEHLSHLGKAQECKFEWATEKHIVPQFGNFALSEISTMALQEWFNVKQKAGLSKSTRKGLKAIFSGIFERAIAWRIHQEANPLTGVILHGEDDARKKVKLSDENIRQFLSALRCDVRLLCCSCLFCTLRVSEGFALQEKHLDFDRNVIMVRQSYYRGSLRKAPKSKKGSRDIPMGYLADELKRLMIGDPERFVFQIVTKPNWGREERVCRDDRDLNQHFLRPAAKKLGFYFPGFGFRALRREAITEIGSVAGLGQAMDAAGHSTVDLSLLYTVQDREKQEKAIRGFQERILGDGSKLLQ